MKNLYTFRKWLLVVLVFPSSLIFNGCPCKTCEVELPSKEEQYHAVLFAPHRQLGVSAFVYSARATKDSDHWKGSSYTQLYYPVTPTTVYRIGSITKSFTAALILKLQEEGKLSVSDPLSKYYPFPFANVITLQNLLSMSSGIPSEGDLFRLMQSPDDLIQNRSTVVQSAGFLRFQPGTAYEYSNVNYQLLGKVIEVVTGKSYVTVLREKILDPLNLTSTYLDPYEGSPLTTPGYTYNGSYWYNSSNDINPAAYWAAGGLCCTAEDLQRWYMALATNQFLTAQSFAEMTQPRVLVAPGVSYCYALNYQLTPYGPEWFHGGLVAGFEAGALMIPSMGAYVTVLTNSGQGEASAMADQILSIAMQ